MSAEHKILVIGSGGREDAIGRKLMREARLFFAPGNGGTAGIGKNIDIGVNDVDKLSRFASDNVIDLTIVGPEGPLSEGIVDAFEEDGLAIFGPSKAAARLESSKLWSSKFMVRHSIPSAQFREFQNPEDALHFVNRVGFKNTVIKADGLCAGKGVVLPNSTGEAETAILGMLSGKDFGTAGKTILIQERLKGPEISVMAISDGKVVVPLLPARDHKRVFDGDKGPNTGGMGAYAPVPDVTTGMLQDIYEHILLPTVSGMYEEGIPYKGVLYAGLMLTADGPKVLEYNCRPGDPETQPLMTLLQSELAPVLLSSIKGTLKKSQIKFRSGYSVCVVLTSGGYPGRYASGEVVHGATGQYENTEIIHAGTSYRDGLLVTCGGRVLGVTSYGKTLKEAARRAYSVIGTSVYFKGMHYRSDIAA